MKTANTYQSNDSKHPINLKTNTDANQTVTVSVVHDDETDTMTRKINNFTEYETQTQSPKTAPKYNFLNMNDENKRLGLSSNQSNNYGQISMRSNIHMSRYKDRGSLDHSDIKSTTRMSSGSMGQRYISPRQKKDNFLRHQNIDLNRIFEKNKNFMKMLKEKPLSYFDNLTPEINMNHHVFQRPIEKDDPDRISEIKPQIGSTMGMEELPPEELSLLVQ